MTKILFGATLLCVAVVIGGIHRGFDISDEGLYTLLAHPSQENKAGIFNYDLFFKSFYRLTRHSFSVAELRVLRLLSYLLGALALAGFWKNSSAEPKFNPQIFWISCLGLFSGYGFLPPTLSYNSLTVVLICFWLFFISNDQKSLRTTLFLGIILAALVYVKISLALLFFPLTFLILIFRQKLKPIYSLGLILPVIVSELLFQILFNENAWIRLQAGIPLNSQRTGYQIGLMLESIAVGGFWVVLMAALFFGMGYFRRTNSFFYPAMNIITAFSALVIGYLTHITEEWNHLFLLAAAAFLGFQTGTGAFKPAKMNFWFLLLLALPFLLHFGSNVYWLRIGIHYLVFWILAAKWMLKSRNWEVNFVTLGFSVFLVFNGIWWYPFGHEKPLWAEKVRYQLEEGQTLLLDPDLVEIVSEIKIFYSGQSDSTILAAYRIPGLVYLTGTTIPLSPTLWEKSQLSALLRNKPKAMIYNKFEDLPENWIYENTRDLGVFCSDSLQLLWD